MKCNYFLLVFLFLTSVVFGQTNFTFNSGGTEQVNYFTTLPYEKVNDKIIIKIKVKDKTHRFILDTGAPTIIDAKLFEELKPTVLTKLSISDANNAIDSMILVSLSDIALNEVVFQNIPTLVSKSNKVFECFEVDGIIGSNLMRNSIIQIDETNKKVILTDNVKKLNLSSVPSSKLFLDKQSSPIIWIQLKNKSKAKEQLLFDTGMQGLYDLSLYHFETFKENEVFDKIQKGEGSNALGIHGIAKDTTIYRIHLPVLEINGIKFQNVLTQTTMDNNSRIGSKLLHYGTVTVDYKNKKFYFKPNSNNAIDAHEKQFPINIIPKNDKLYISTVWDDKLKSQINAGDQILEIDSKSFEKIDFCDLILKSTLKGKDKILLKTKNSNGEIIETILYSE